MASSPADILSSPARSVTVGSRPVRQRRILGVLQKAATLVLLGATAFAAQAQDSPRPVGTVHTTEAETNPSIAVATQPARQASNSLLDKAGQGAVAWMSPAGQVDAKAMIEQWRQGGVSVEQAFELISVLVLTQSPVIGRTPGSLEEAAETSASTRSIADLQNARDAEFFLQHHGIEALLETCRISVLEALNVQTGAERFDKSWDQALDYWKALGSQRPGEVPLVETGAAASGVAAAQKVLVRAVEQVGLASLRVPLAVWGNPDAMTAMADRLVEANTTLEQLTGWSGQVLGLSGRVSIRIFSPAGNAFTYWSTDDSLRLDTSWELMPHEWLHALDDVLRTTPIAQVPGGASLSHQVFTDGPTDEIGQAWKAMSVSWSTSETARDWLEKRQSLLDSLSEGLSEEEKASPTLDGPRNEAMLRAFGPPSEMMAYAWGAYVQSQVSRGGVFHDTHQDKRTGTGIAFDGEDGPTEKAVVANDRVDPYDGEHGPTVAQASAMKKDWQALFKTVGQQWWVKQAAPPVQMPSLGQWRQARQAEQPLPPKPTRTALEF